MQWYPGHIARAEKLLREQLRAVDAVVEVRDIRIPLATTHPDIPDWIGNKLRVLVSNRADDGQRRRAQPVGRLVQAQRRAARGSDGREERIREAAAEVALMVSAEVNDKRRAKGLMPSRCGPRSWGTRTSASPP